MRFPDADTFRPAGATATTGMKSATFGTLLPAALLSLFPLTAAAGGGGKVPVFVSVLPQRYLAERVGGERVDVSVMVGPGRSPATYEPTPKQMARLGAARIYFRIGVPFERVWMEKIAGASPSMTVVDTGEGVGSSGSDGGRRDGAGGYRQVTDPHLWTSPRLAGQIALRMRAALVAADPEHREEYEAGYDLLAADLARLDGEIRDILARVRHRKFIVFHPSWGHFADTYELEQIAIERGGSDPGARYLAEVIETARREGIGAVFVQQQFSSRSAEAVAKAIGGRVVTVDPLAEDYIVNLKSVAELFAKEMR